MGDERRGRQPGELSARRRMRPGSEGGRDQGLRNGRRTPSNKGTRWSEMEMKRNVRHGRQLTIEAIIYLLSHPLSCLPGCLGESGAPLYLWVLHYSRSSEHRIYCAASCATLVVRRTSSSSWSVQGRRWAVSRRHGWKPAAKLQGRPFITN